jgi:hypothetical protein
MAEVEPAWLGRRHTVSALKQKVLYEPTVASLLAARLL